MENVHLYITDDSRVIHFLTSKTAQKISSLLQATFYVIQHVNYKQIVYLQAALIN